MNRLMDFLIWVAAEIVPATLVFLLVLLLIAVAIYMSASGQRQKGELRILMMRVFAAFLYLGIGVTYAGGAIGLILVISAFLDGAEQVIKTIWIVFFTVIIVVLLIFGWKMCQWVRITTRRCISVITEDME